MIPAALLCPEAEQAVLGCLLTQPSPEQIAAVRQALPAPSDFATGQHAAIYRAMLACFDHGLPVDAITLRNTLTAHGTLEASGGLPYLADLADAVATAAGVEAYAEVVADRAARRALYATAGSPEVVALDLATPLTTSIPALVSKISTLGTSRATGAPVAVGGLCYPTVEALASPPAPGAVGGPLPTGVPSLDALVDGWAPDRLCVIAGRPGSGKTAYGCHAALAMATVGTVLFCSLEMAQDQILQRFLENLSGVSLGRHRSTPLTDRDLTAVATAAGVLSQLPIYIDTATRTPQEIAGAIDRLRPTLTQPLVAVVVDYLSLLKWPFRTERRDLEVGALARALKMDIARRYQVPVLCLAQLRRLGQAEGSRAPRLDDLRESGEIEQHADQVVLLHYGVNEPPAKDGTTWPSPFLTKLHVAKNRYGAPGIADAHYDRRTHHWADWR